MEYGAGTGVLAIAHRGGAALGPENTLLAFERSTALGIRYLETDVRTTRDGVLVCAHDRSLKRVAGVHASVAELEAREIGRLRVLDGEPMPTLAEALGSFPDACFSIDPKDLPSVHGLLALIAANPGWSHRICVAGAWDGWLRGFVDAGVTTSLGFRSLSALIACSKSGTRVPAWVARAPYAHVPLRLGRLPVFASRVVPAAARIGVDVVVWTVDEPDEMHRLLDAGVRGLITDHPDRLREVLISRGEWQPMASDQAVTGNSSRA